MHMVTTRVSLVSSGCQSFRWSSRPSGWWWTTVRGLDCLWQSRAAAQLVVDTEAALDEEPVPAMPA
eukprot:1163914-Amphidinium_carterae.1